MLIYFLDFDEIRINPTSRSQDYTDVHRLAIKVIFSGTGKLHIFTQKGQAG